MATLTNQEIGALRQLLAALRVVANENVKGENERLRPVVEKLTEENNRLIQERNGWAGEVSDLTREVKRLRETLGCVLALAPNAGTPCGPGRTNGEREIYRKARGALAEPNSTETTTGK
jgi:hypothetical protein